MEKINAILKNQSGAALVIALVMMVVLTLIGLASIFTSVFEIKVSENKGCGTQSFYAADSEMQLVESKANNFSPKNEGEYNPFADTATNPYDPPNAESTVAYNDSKHGVPRGSGMSAINFEFEYFRIVSQGESCPNPVPTTTTIQEWVVRLVPTAQGGN
jgi:Tfp pilus assembly protein PilX